MHTTHIPLSFASHTLHLVEFAPDSLHEHDLLWLPHYAQLAACGRKRQAEHLAGRIAAVHALREYGSKAVPGIGERRQPLWPPGLFGSISHSASTALAVVSPRPIGLDIDAILHPTPLPNWLTALSTTMNNRFCKVARSPFRSP